ncbi:pupal cuticle protein Edg-78E [Rhagoletis pomonella]|uniref:pupal cuticle protein Edg-78E n=1 Tax=Rhagoletis pomonella TaxID=28610 RepID=UPI0017849105|nr:pupal cuticle protein Edg-78E [Rhagoletis pomonella]
MFRFTILTTLIAIAASQGYHQNPKTAAIISEQRYLAGDGKFGAAYTQEDGINFKEETDSDGTRHGSYSYVDPTGERRTISYTAGKNGFQASGDHLPVAPPAPPQPVPQAGYAPQPQYQPPQPQSGGYRSNDYDDGSYDPRYNDPSFDQSQGSYQPPQPQYQPQAAPAYQPPAPAYNPPAPQYNNYQPQAQPQQQPYYQPTTPNPHRFAPPGKLSLNRTPDGFSYSFNKV